MRLALCALLPIIGSALLSLVKFPSRRARNVFVEVVTALTSACVFAAALAPSRGAYALFRVGEAFVCAFQTDGLGRTFVLLAAGLWPFASLYAFEYMAHESREGQFFTFYTLAYAVTILIAASANLFTLYIFFELLTLVTLPLVDHGHDHSVPRRASQKLYKNEGHHRAHQRLHRGKPVGHTRHSGVQPRG